MKTAELEGDNAQALAAEQKQFDTGRTLNGVMLHEAVKEFVYFVTKSETITPIKDSAFYNSIAEFVQSKKNRRAYRKFSFAQCSPITLLIPDELNRQEIDMETLRRLVSQHITKSFRSVFLGYMGRYMRRGGRQSDGIRDFCVVYNISNDPSTFKMLKKSWCKSAEKKQLETA
jgi:hypothetical protein